VISADAVLSALKLRGYGLLAGVPCSYVMGLIELASADPDTVYVPAANEGAALAIARTSRPRGRGSRAARTNPASRSSSIRSA